jgi:PAS domain S-box-containing protein
MEFKFFGSVQDLPDADRLELLVGAVMDYAIYLLDREGVIRTWNAGAERITGYSSGEAIGQHFSLFFTGEDKAAEAPSQILAGASLSGRGCRGHQP